MKSVIDTSALIDAWSYSYRIQKFPKIWEEFGQRIKKGELVSHVEVREELKKKEKDLFKWMNKFGSVFHEYGDAEVKEHARLVNQFPHLVDLNKSGPQADSYIIAMAKHRGMQVVTSESKDGILDPRGAKKIPDVCQILGIPCVRLAPYVHSLPGRYE